MLGRFNRNNLKFVFLSNFHILNFGFIVYLRDTGQTVNLRLHAGMITTVADTTATLDVVAYASDEEAGIGADLCTTAAQSINSLVFADYDYVITATALAPGDVLDVRIHTAVNDAAGGATVKACVGATQLLCDTVG